MKILVNMLVAFLVSGCAVYQSTQPDRPEKLNFNGNFGYVIGTFSRATANPKYNDYTMYLASEDGTIKEEVFVSDGLLTPFKYDFKDEKSEGSLFAIELPAGKYYVQNYKIVFNNGQVYKTWGARENLNLPFTIEPGKATYVGELRFIPVFGENVFGMDIPGGGYYVFVDSKERDIPLIQKFYPELTDQVVSHQVPKK